MIGFNLRIEKGSIGRIQALTIDYDEYLKFHQNKQQVLFLFNDTYPGLYKKNDYIFYVIGSLIYKDLWNIDALEEISNDLTKGIRLHDIMPETHGQFSLLVSNNKRTTIITDKLASFPIYLYEDQAILHASNIFLNIVRNNPVTFDYQAVAEYCSFDYCFNSTLFHEIKLLEHGSIYNFPDTVSPTKYDNFLNKLQFNRYQDLDEATDKAKKILIANFRFLKTKSPKNYIDLTGGLDSRLTASILKFMGVQFEAGLCGEQIVGEQNISQKICDLLNLKRHADIKIKDVHTFIALAGQHFDLSNGVPLYLHSTELLYYYHYIKKNFDLHIAGFAGSQIFGDFLPSLSFFSKDLRPQNLILNQLSCKDILKESILDKKDYNRNLSEKIDNWLDKLGTREHDRASTYFTSTVFCRFYHGSIIGLHNTILPFYVPYLEADILRLMIATARELKNFRLLERNLITIFNQEISRVISSHGYSAHVDSIKTPPLQHKIKRELRKIRYDITPVNSLLRLIEKRLRRPAKLAELQRNYWIDHINRHWINDSGIFDFIDQKKLAHVLARDVDANRLKAKILYLNLLKAQISTS